MATVGQQLLAPETTWRRYDDSDSRIKYMGTDWLISTNTNYYASTTHYLPTNSPNIINNSVSFKFYGSKLRIVEDFYFDYSTSMTINIDGVDYTPYSVYNATILYKILAFEKLDLTMGLHVVTIKSNNNRWALDAIDIDDIGYLINPILNEISDFSQVKNIGDCVPYHYKATTSGQVGVFSDSLFTNNEIPVASSAIPDGLFYWVYVGKDYQGRKKFIADRNIQHSISWDTLNSAGIVSEKIIDLGFGNRYRSTIRLITGGTSATDTDNEWDKIVAGSTLNGNITLGDDNIWHWNSVCSWTTTTHPTGSSNRVARGYNALNGYLYGVAANIASTNGFRRVLLIEQLAFDKFFIKKDSKYYSIKPEYYDVASHSYLPLVLSGVSSPNKADIDLFGFDLINDLLTQITVGGDTFKPKDKLPNNMDIRYYKKL